MVITSCISNRKIRYDESGATGDIVIGSAPAKGLENTYFKHKSLKIR